MSSTQTTGIPGTCIAYHYKFMCIKTHLNTGTRKIPVHENAHSLFIEKIQCTLYYTVVSL